jgi:hypothetical protein
LSKPSKICNGEFDSNVIDENAVQHEKHSDPRSSTLLGILICDDEQQYVSVTVSKSSLI